MNMLLKAREVAHCMADSGHRVRRVPTMCSAMLHEPGEFDTSSLQVCISGGAPMPVEVLRAFELRYAG
jgi:acyl-CoA synthetase (AMP-forming)/AMP-acid ligase II